MTPDVLSKMGTEGFLFYNYKITICGSYFQIRKFHRAICIKMNKNKKYNGLSAFKSTKDKFIALVRCNAQQYFNKKNKPYSLMLLTLTFKENITDLTTAHKNFMKFIQKFNTLLFGRKNTKLKYAGVIEFQERGAIHYHLILFNMPYIEQSVYSKIRKIWGLENRFKLELVRSPYGTTNYLSKYLVKSLGDERLKNRRKILASQHLKRPIVIYNDSIAEKILKQVQEKIKIHEHGYYSKWTGQTTSYSFNLGTGKNYTDLALDKIGSIVLDLKQRQFNPIQNP